MDAINTDHPSGVTYRQLLGYLPGHLAYAVRALWLLGSGEQDESELLNDAATFLELQAQHLGDAHNDFFNPCNALQKLATAMLEHERRPAFCIVLAALGASFLYPRHLRAMAAAIRPAQEAAGG